MTGRAIRCACGATVFAVSAEIETGFRADHVAGRRDGCGVLVEAETVEQLNDPTIGTQLTML